MGDAARANMALALSICLQNYQTPDQIRPAFEAAGFAYEPEVFGPDDVIHWYIAPARTASAMVQPEQGFCAVSTSHMGVSDALPYAGAVLQQVFGPGVEVTPGSPENENILPGTPEGQGRACSGYSVLVPRSMIWAQVGNAGQDPVCIEDGTSQIMLYL